MNDFEFAAKVNLERGDVAPFDVGSNSTEPR